jgi:hypothetical protein
MQQLTAEQKTRAEEWYENTVKAKNCLSGEGAHRRNDPIGVAEVGSLRVVVFVCAVCGRITMFSAENIGV